MSNALHTKDGAPIPKELRYSYPVDCIFLEYSHHWRLLQGENPLTHHHSWLCWDFLLLLDLPCKGIRQHLMALIRIPKFGKFLLVESGTLGVQFKESKIPLTIGNRNPSSTEKESESSTWNRESMPWNLESKPLHGVKPSAYLFALPSWLSLSMARSTSQQTNKRRIYWSIH